MDIGEPGQLSGFTTAIHASNMYCLNNVVQRGLYPGPAKGIGDTCGLYVFENSGHARLTRSSGYAMCSKIPESGLYFAPYHLVAWQDFDRWRGREPVKISVGGCQLCLPQWLYSHVGTWIHVLSLQKIERGCLRWANYDDFQPLYEAPLGSEPLEPPIAWPPQWS